MFVALDLPEEARAAIAAWCCAFTAGNEGVRPVAAGQLHVTLAFLGWTEEGLVERIAAATFDAAAGIEAPRLRPSAVRAVPPRRPRLLVLDLDDEGGRAAALHAAVAAALEALGVRPEKRPFWPHITVARVRRGARAPTRFTLSTQEVPNVTPVLPGEPFSATRLTLYRSTLRPQGALYEPLARMTLRRG